MHHYRTDEGRNGGKSTYYDSVLKTIKASAGKYQFSDQVRK